MKLSCLQWPFELRGIASAPLDLARQCYARPDEDSGVFQKETSEWQNHIAFMDRGC